MTEEAQQGVLTDDARGMYSSDKIYSDLDLESLDAIPHGAWFASERLHKVPVDCGVRWSQVLVQPRVEGRSEVKRLDVLWIEGRRSQGRRVES